MYQLYGMDYHNPYTMFESLPSLFHVVLMLPGPCSSSVEDCRDTGTCGQSVKVGVLHLAVTNDDTDEPLITNDDELLVNIG